MLPKSSNKLSINDGPTVLFIRSYATEPPPAPTVPAAATASSPLPKGLLTALSPKSKVLPASCAAPFKNLYLPGSLFANFSKKIVYFL